ncbi:MAG: FixH family protein [Alphaproteobacteria bacterium]|nr:FixH family protein [Alphaproteobacteria bacterium]
MTGSPPETGKDMPRDRWIPWLIVAFFGIVVLANGVMVYLAVSSFTGLQTEGPYLRGLAYNRVLEAERAERALDWSVTVEFRPTGDRRGRIVARAQDAAGAPLVGAAVTARLVRPTQAGYDMQVTLAAESGGTYAADVELPLSGLWEIRTQIVHRSDVYRTAHRTLTR